MRQEGGGPGEAERAGGGREVASEVRSREGDGETEAGREGDGETEAGWAGGTEPGRGCRGGEGRAERRVGHGEERGMGKPEMGRPREMGGTQVGESGWGRMGGDPRVVGRQERGTEKWKRDEGRERRGKRCMQRNKEGERRGRTNRESWAD